MSYKGLEMTSQDNYIFSDTIPYSPEFELEELITIQNKIENYTSGRSYEGITSQEAEVLLDWVTFNARNYAVRGIPESPVTANMSGQCAPTQRINYKVLSKMGLDVRPFNIADCIGEVPMNNEDITRVQNGFSTPAIRHSVSLVNIPIIDNYGNTQLHKFLLDPTFRQFCQRKDCQYERFFSQNNSIVAPSVGYFMEANNLRQLGVTEEMSQKTENLGKYIISKGYFYLNEENAKLYGDAFSRASRRLEFQNYPIYTSGQQYISNFENIPMRMIDSNNDKQYTKLPSELEEDRKGIFKKFFDFLKGKFRKEPMALQAGNINEQQNYYTKPNLEGCMLNPEEMEYFRRGEQEILNNYNNNQYYENTYTNETEITR